MKIRWLGHSCFLITADSGETLITDPYNTEAYPETLLLAPLDISTDVITSSHNHADHGNIEAIGGTPVIIKTPAPREAAGFSVRGVEAFHDNQAGVMRGDIIIFIIKTGDITVCHLGDLGHELTSDQARDIGAVDVLLIPVGGNFTIDAAAATRIWQQLAPPLTFPCTTVMTSASSRSTELTGSSPESRT
ncbi:MAG: MBL fold metallo-hydrolase [Thermoleophilia bacterium]|jgi:L-ascorbate metabolism protein UlaG (beta-lactamase superfamily)